MAAFLSDLFTDMCFLLVEYVHDWKTSRSQDKHPDTIRKCGCGNCSNGGIREGENRQSNRT